jgi:hypothetical protein
MHRHVAGAQVQAQACQGDNQCAEFLRATTPTQIASMLLMLTLMLLPH